MVWAEVTVVTSREAAEAVAAAFHDLAAPGLAIEERTCGGRDPAGVRLRAWWPADDRLGERVAALRARLEALPAAGLDPGPGTVELSRVADADWAEAWKAHLRPVRAGPFWVAPTWASEPPPPGPGGCPIPLILDPGMAFGTGHHPTTVFCLEALARRAGRGARAGGRLDGQRVLDAGTGTGILAVAAARLGAAVVAVDADPEAVRAARENVRRNGVAAAVKVVCADLGQWLEGAGPFDGITANLTADFFTAHAGRLWAALRPGGWCAAAGIGAERAAPALDALARAGFGEVRREVRDGWVGLELERTA